MDKQLRQVVDTLVDQVKQVIRRMDSQEKTLNLIYSDRDIQEGILLKIDASNREAGNLREELKLLSERIAKLEKNTTANVKEVLGQTQDIKDSIERDNKGGE